MRQFICVCCILFAFASCKTTKVIDKEQRQNYHYTADSVHASSEVSWVKALIDEMMSEQAMHMSVEKLTIYDTSKPIDPETGKAPILAEYERKDSTSCLTTVETKDSIYVMHEVSGKDSASVCVSDSAYTYTHIEKKSESKIGRDAVGIAALVILMILLVAMVWFSKLADKNGL